MKKETIQKVINFVITVLTARSQLLLCAELQVIF